MKGSLRSKITSGLAWVVVIASFVLSYQMSKNPTPASEAQELELPSIFHLLGGAHPKEFLERYHDPVFGITLEDWIPTIMCILVGFVLVGFSLWATRRLEKIPRGSQAFAEIIVEGLYNFLGEMLGPYTRRYLSFLGTLFLYIILMNLMGLIPLLHSPTNKINVTFSMALPVFVFYNFEAVRIRGLKYFKHFAEPLFMAPLMLPIHLIGEFVRPISLSVRLFGNLTGEDLTIALLVIMTPFLFGFIPVPVHLIMVLMALLFSTIQATIFTLLSTIYLSEAIGAQGEDHH
jgi:F-type H+-transporting ATPase subunit a